MNRAHYRQLPDPFALGGHRGRPLGGDRAPDGLRNQSWQCLATITLHRPAFQPLARVSRTIGGRRSLPADKRRHLQSTYTLSLRLVHFITSRRLTEQSARNYTTTVTKSTIASDKGSATDNLNDHLRKYKHHVRPSIDQKTDPVDGFDHGPRVST